MGPRVLGVDSSTALGRAGDLEPEFSSVVLIRTRFDGRLSSGLDASFRAAELVILSKVGMFQMWWARQGPRCRLEM